MEFKTCAVTAFLAIFSLSLFFSSEAAAQGVNSCFKVTLEKPQRSYDRMTVGIRGYNRCKRPVHFDYRVCSNSKSIYAGSSLQHFFSGYATSRGTSPYEYETMGGFTYKRGTKYEFVYRISYSELKGDTPCQNKGGGNNSDSTDVSNFVGNWVGSTFNGQRKVFNNRINISVSGREVILSVSNQDVDTGAVSNGRLRARIKGNQLIVKNFGGTWTYTVEGSTLLMSGRRFTGKYQRQ